MGQRLVIFVEGKGNKTAVPALARRVLTASWGNDALFVDVEPFVVKGVGKLVKDNYTDWHRWLGAAAKTRKNMGAVLLVLDGDLGQVPAFWSQDDQQHKFVDFCAYRVAATLANAARPARAGEIFSLAVVFAMKEFEAWLVAGVESLRGIPLAEGRGAVPPNVSAPNIDIEAKRDAKGVLRQLISGYDQTGYDQTLDQGVLAGKVDLAMVRNRCRSFRRFESAIQQLSNAVRTGNAIVTPTL